MAIIYSYPTVVPSKTDLILGTDVSTTNKSTKNFTVQSIIDLVTIATGDLQTVLDLGNIATGKDIVLGTLAIPSNTMHAATFTTGPGLLVLSGNTGTGFTSITSTDFVGNVSTPAQPDITSLGVLTSLKVGNATPAITSIVTTITSPGDDIKLATTKAIVDYVATKPNKETLAETLVAGNITDGKDIVVSAGDDITFTDTSKAIFGNSGDLEINHNATPSVNANEIACKTGKQLRITQDNLFIGNEAGDETFIAAINGGLVTLHHNGGEKLATTSTGVSVTGGVEATGSGTFVNLLNTGTYSDSSGDVGTNGQLLSSTGTGTNWVTELPLYNWSFEGTAIPSGTAVTVTDGNNITTTWDAAGYALTIAASGDGVTGSGADGQVAFWTGVQTESGNGQFLYDATKARVRILSNAVTGSGVIGAAIFTTELTSFPTPGSSPTWTGSTMTNMTSIASTSFVGDLTGNATTASDLATTGTMSVSGDVSTVGTPPTYTGGGNKTIATTIADTVVTGKVLTNLPTPTSSSVLASDTILAAMAKLQGQISGIAGSLAFEGTWDASTGSPPSASPVNGQFWIVSVNGSTNLSGITDWKVGDWAIYVSNGTGTDAWQKLDQSNEVLGSGTAQKMAMWSGTVGDASQTLATGLIEQNAANNLITIGNSGGLTVQGSTTLGDSTSDTVTAKGSVTFDTNLDIKQGISVDGTAGTDGYVLTSGNGIGAVMRWEQPKVGTVTTVSASTGGDALDVAVTNPTTTPAIALTWAGGASGATKYVNGLGNLILFPTLDNYASWTADSDEGTDITVTSGFNLKFVGATETAGAGIATDSAVSANEMTIGLVNAGGTPSTTTFYRGDGQWAVPAGTGVTSVTGTLPIKSSGGNTPAISIDTMTAATAGAGGLKGAVPASAAGDEAKFLRGDATWATPTDLKGVETITVTAPITGGGTATSVGIGHKAVLTDNSGNAGTYTSANVTVDGDGHITGITNGHGSNGGVFTGSKAYSNATDAGLFTVTRASSGNLIFDVYLTSDKSAGGTSRKFTVAHKLNVDPVFNEIIAIEGTVNFTAAFTNATSAGGTTGDSVLCTITPTGTQDVYYTVQVGNAERALTVTTVP